MNDPDGSEVGAGREDDDMAAALVDRLYRLDAEVEAGRAPDDATDAADDEALAGLRMVRGLVARVRDEAPEVEPPQAMSARLLQAAAEHAPRKARAAAAGPGLWARVRGWFAAAAAHPGLAAAATVVVVAGVGSALYLRGKSQVAEPTIDERHAGAARGSDEPGDRSADDTPPAAAGAAAGSGVAAPVAPATAATIEEKAPERVDEDGVADDGKAAPREASQPAPVTGSRGHGATAAKREAPGPSGGDSGGAEDGDRWAEGVLTDDVRDEADKPAPPRGRSEAGGAAAPETTGAPPPAPAPPPPPPPPTTQKAPAKTKSSGGGGATTGTTSTSQGQASQPTPAELARQLTRQAVTAARAGNCALVETLGDRVRKLDATWYASGFAKQPDIVACRAKRN